MLQAVVSQVIDAIKYEFAVVAGNLELKTFVVVVFSDVTVCRQALRAVRAEVVRQLVLVISFIIRDLLAFLTLDL